MYVYIYICIYVYMYICIYIYICFLVFSLVMLISLVIWLFWLVTIWFFDVFNSSYLFMAVSNLRCIFCMLPSGTVISYIAIEAMAIEISCIFPVKMVDLSTVMWLLTLG